MQIIGISGKKGHGKDALYRELCDLAYDRFGRSVHVVRAAFGDGVKQEIANTLGISREEIEAKKNTLFRPLLQWWGTEYRRGQDPDYWVKYIRPLIDQCRATMRPGDILCITDVRFKNEAELVRAIGGRVVRVVRPEPWWRRLWWWVTRKGDRHRSETELDHYRFDDIIHNNGTLDDLREAATFLLTEE